MTKLFRARSIALSVRPYAQNAQEVETEFGRALAYSDEVGEIIVGDLLLLNRTARQLQLGTGGYDFVIARLAPERAESEPSGLGHIIKNRYASGQLAVYPLEEHPEYESVWTKRLDGFPVVAAELYSQLAPVAGALSMNGAKVAYIASDAAALPFQFGKLATRLKELGVIEASITADQAYGGDYETVTIFSALLAAKHILQCDAAIIVQGPGNAGTGTKYGFSGIRQADALNAAHVLGGLPIAVVRMSSGDKRSRHFGVSHHSITVMEAALAPCIIPIPVGTERFQIPERHAFVEVDGAREALEWAQHREIPLKTMGRGIDDDALFFESAAAAGLYASGRIPHFNRAS
jgi:hypothetical protein